MHSSRAAKIKTKSYKHRKKWLLAKVQSLKYHYDEILGSFRKKLDRIVDPVISKADALLLNADEDEFLSSCFEIGINLEKSSNDLYEINLYCLGDLYSSDGESEQSDVDIPHPSVQISPTVVSSENCSQSFNKVSLLTTSKPIGEALSEEVQNDFKYEENKPSPEKHETPKMEDPKDISESSDIDLLLLHNIKLGESTRVLVSDVINPSSFSVQPEDSKQQLLDLQRELNSLYSQQWTDQLKFVDQPKPGTICVALFTIDHCWYRAKVLKELSNDKYEVVYIDYGNRHVVKNDNLRVIDPSFGNIPQLSIQCSLFGVEPAVNKGEPAMKWSVPATDWFDQQVFGKWFVAQFAQQRKNQSLYSAHLFLSKDSTAKRKLYHSQGKSAALSLFFQHQQAYKHCLISSENGQLGQASTWSVADNLVCMGYAAFTSRLTKQIGDNDNSKGDYKERSLMSHGPVPRRNLLQPCVELSKSESDVKIIPGGFESTFSFTSSRNREALRNKVSRSNHFRSNSAETPSRANGSSAQAVGTSSSVRAASPRSRHKRLSADWACSSKNT